MTTVTVGQASRGRRGYSGTSTRDLTAALGLSTSSLYAAFGSKAGLFEEAVRTYAERYREIYRQAVAEKDLRTVIDQILIDSVHE
ncbi:TetR/AcrR family transcriptional regulator [Streptomyces decoyicus]